MAANIDTANMAPNATSLPRGTNATTNGQQSVATGTSGTTAPSNRQQSGRSSSENKERAYVAASRRGDRSLEARVESARMASQIHFERTGKRLKVDENIVRKEEMYEEEDDRMPRRFLGALPADMPEKMKMAAELRLGIYSQMMNPGGDIDAQFAAAFPGLSPHRPTDHPYAPSSQVNPQATQYRHNGLSPLPPHQPVPQNLPVGAQVMIQTPSRDSLAMRQRSVTQSPMAVAQSPTFPQSPMIVGHSPVFPQSPMGVAHSPMFQHSPMDMPQSPFSQISSHGRTLSFHDEHGAFQMRLPASQQQRSPMNYPVMYRGHPSPLNLQTELNTPVLNSSASPSIRPNVSMDRRQTVHMPGPQPGSRRKHGDVFEQVPTSAGPMGGPIYNQASPLPQNLRRHQSDAGLVETDPFGLEARKRRQRLDERHGSMTQALSVPRLQDAPLPKKARVASNGNGQYLDQVAFQQQARQSSSGNGDRLEAPAAQVEENRASGQYMRDAAVQPVEKHSEVEPAEKHVKVEQFVVPTNAVESTAATQVTGQQFASLEKDANVQDAAELDDNDIDSAGFFTTGNGFGSYCDESLNTAFGAPDDNQLNSEMFDVNFDQQDFNHFDEYFTFPASQENEELFKVEESNA